MDDFKNEHIKIVKPLKGLTFYYQPIYKKWKNHKFKSITLLDLYQYDFLSTFTTPIITDKWLKLKFTKNGEVYLISTYNQQNKKFNDNTGNLVGLTNKDKNIKYNKPLFEGYYTKPLIIDKPYIVFHKKKRTLIGDLTHEENHTIQLYIRYIVDFFNIHGLHWLTFPKVYTNKEEKLIYMLECMYLKFKAEYTTTIDINTTHKFNYTVVNSLLTKTDDYNYRVFFNLFINFKLNWNGTLYNNMFVNDFYKLKQDLIHIKNE